MMSKRENALRTIKFDHPEYIMGGVPCHTLCYTGCNHEGYRGGGHDCPVGTRWTDIWGTGWQKEQTDVMGFPRRNPLAEIESLANYDWPDPNDERVCRLIYEMKDAYAPGDYFLAGAHRDTLWEKAYMLVGMENMMAYFYDEPNYAREILRRIMDFQLGIAEHYIKLGVEVAVLGDDLGTQRGLLIGPQLLYNFFVPEYKRLTNLYKKHGVLIGFHSCGHIEPALDLFMELGIDVLNPLQANANNLKAVRARTQGRMALQGGVSTGLIMSGPPEAIDAAVRDAIHLLGRDGGYFCSPDQGMPFPQKHIDAFAAAVEKYGRYPLCPQ